MERDFDATGHFVILLLLPAFIKHPKLIDSATSLSSI